MVEMFRYTVVCVVCGGNLVKSVVFDSYDTVPLYQSQMRNLFNLFDKHLLINTYFEFFFKI